MDLTDSLRSFMNITAWSSHSEENDLPSRTSRSLGHLRNFSQSLSFSGLTQPATYPDQPRRADLKTPYNIYDPDADEELRKLGSNSPADSMSPIDDCDMSTLPDPRERHDSHDDQRPTTSSTDTTTDEITLISNKLVAAINRQTILGDALAASREEARAAKETIARLEGVIIKQKEMVAGDVWIRKTAYEAEKCDLIAKIGEEKRLRLDAEKAKIAMERELEELSTALFNEANNLVIAAKEEARKEKEIIMKKNEQLKAQVAETEDLLRDQQDQLAQLKLVMGRMDTVRDDHSAAASSSARSTRICPSREDLIASDSRYLSPTATENPAHVHAAHSNSHAPSHAHSNSGQSSTPVVPASPTTFTHLVTPVLNTDITAFEEFKGLIHASQNVTYRNSGGSFSGSSFIGASLSVGGVAGGLTSSAASIMSSAASIHSAASSSTMAVPQLKDLKFFKRALVEDIDPTLRMDAAVHISWLARRSAHAAVIDGTLVVEPVHSNEPLTALSHPHYYPCSMCGEKRKSVEFLRTHRFRYNDTDTASRYPLCPYCLTRIRTTCEYIGFLRILKDGHWRSEDDEDEKAAWEESVRLREQMFWARIGGGVVPVQHTAPSEGAHSTAPSVIEVERDGDAEHEGDISIPSIVASDYPDAVSDHAIENVPNNAVQNRAPNHLTIPEQDEETDSASDYEDDASDHASVFGPDIETPVTDTMEINGVEIDEKDLPTPIPQDYGESSFPLTRTETAQFAHQDSSSKMENTQESKVTIARTSASDSEESEEEISPFERSVAAASQRTSVALSLSSGLPGRRVN